MNYKYRRPLNLDLAKKVNIAKKQGFRLDINSIRAIAVVLVVLYHFGVPGFGGGFIGVDVFFVISGYLMTSIISTRLDASNFSLARFYFERAIRIIPALLVLILCLTAIGGFFLLPSEFRTLGKHGAAALSFISNVVFWREAGYFDADSHTKWLLHTWSLSVEWQFYLLYPIFLIALRRVASIRITKILLFVCALCSLTLSAYLSQGDKWPTAAFYLLPTRAWEMIAGGLVFYFPLRERRHTKPIQTVGLIFILFSGFVMSPELGWPGLYALLPVLGTVLIMLVNEQDSLFSKSKILNFLGQASYSIYLWHWPLVVALAYFGLLEAPSAIIIALALSFISGHVSFKYIENPTRRYLATKNFATKRAAVLATFAMVSLLASLSVYFTNGVPRRFSDSVVAADRESFNKSAFRTKCHVSLDPCSISQSQNQKKVVLIGDSHAEAVAPAVVAGLPSRKADDMLLIAVQGCPFVEGGNRVGRTNDCFAQTKRILSLLASTDGPKPPIIVANSWMNYLSSKDGPIIDFVDDQGSSQLTTPFSAAEFSRRYVATMCELSKERTVYLVEPIPSFSVEVPNALARQLKADESSPDISMELSQYEVANKLVLDSMHQAESSCGVKLLDPKEYLCDGKYCYGSKNHRPLYADSNHLSLTGSALLVPLFKSVFSSSP